MLLASLLFAAAAATVPQAQPDPTIASTRAALNLAKDYILKSAEQVPEGMYAYKPSPDVRSMGQLFGHIADANFMICGLASGQKAEMQGVEKTKTTKADLKAALDASFKFCEAAYDGLTAAKADEEVKFFLPGTHTRLGVLTFNSAHLFEHYGNLVTYMRMNKLVPPSSARGM